MREHFSGILIQCKTGFMNRWYSPSNDQLKFAMSRDCQFCSCFNLDDYRFAFSMNFVIF